VLLQGQALGLPGTPIGIDEEEHMPLYAGIDLHANNSYLAVIDETDELN
jgi:hypothetical protein